MESLAAQVTSSSAVSSMPSHTSTRHACGIPYRKTVFSPTKTCHVKWWFTRNHKTWLLRFSCLLYYASPLASLIESQRILNQFTTTSARCMKGFVVHWLQHSGTRKRQRHPSPTLLSVFLKLWRLHMCLSLGLSFLQNMYVIIYASHVDSAVWWVCMSVQRPTAGWIK